MKTVSVHIVTYNSQQFIKDCIDSVLKQNYPIHKIIIIDNDSKDETKLILRSYPNITVVENKQNMGFAAGHNQAIRLSDCEQYLVLNPDVILHPDYVFNLVREFDSNPCLGCATGKLLFKQSPNTVDSTGLTINKARRAFDRGAGDKEGQWNRSDDVFGVSGAAALYSKEMVEEISINGSFFDEDFFAYKEDVDVAWRSRLLGWTASYCSDAVAYHDRGWKKGARNTIPLFVRKLSYINRYKMIIKNDSIKEIVKHIAPLLTYELSSFAYFVIREPRVLSAWGDFIKKLPELLKKRREIQNKKRLGNEIYRYFQ